MNNPQPEMEEHCEPVILDNGDVYIRQQCAQQLINQSTAPLREEIERLNKLLHEVSVTEREQFNLGQNQITQLEKQVLGLRNFLQETIVAMDNEEQGTDRRTLAEAVMFDIQNYLNANPTAQPTGYTKREVLEKCVVELTNGREAMRQLVELANTNEATKEIMRHVGNRWNSTITLANEELKKGQS